MRKASAKMLLDTHLGDSWATRQSETMSWELAATVVASAASWRRVYLELFDVGWRGGKRKRGYSSSVDHQELLQRTDSLTISDFFSSHTASL